MTTMTQDTNLFDKPQVSEKSVDASPSEKLQQECCGCRLSFSWLASNKGLSDADKQGMALALGVTDRKALSASKRLFDSKQPWIKMANELRNRISNYWYGMTIPLAQAHTDDVRLEGGVRLVRRDQIEEFHNRMLAYKSEAETVEQKLVEHRDEILAASRKMLGNKFEASDYPARFQLSFRWGFPSVEIPSYLEELSPEVYQAELRAVKQRFEDTYELATSVMLSEFQAVIASWVARLGPVLKIYPPRGHEHNALAGAKIDERTDNPDGSITLKLRHRPPHEKKSTVHEITVADDNEYASLRAAKDPTEKQTFKNSTVQNLLDLIGKFRNLGGTISSSVEFEGLVDQVSQQIRGFNDAEDLGKELRDSKRFREDTHKLMSELSSNLEGQVVEFTKKRRKIRRMN